ncbi:MAG TPA: copper chaperone PCu(A)C [Parvibaculum sp.]
MASGLAAPGLAAAHEYKLGSLEIGHPWARPSTGKTGAAYFTIKNNGAAEDTLTGVEADISAKVQIHDMEMDGTIMRMRKLDKLALPAGQTVKVAPGGLHVMLIGLKAPLKDGDKFPMRLTFAKAGSVDVSVDVQTPEKAAAGMPGMDQMK